MLEEVFSVTKQKNHLVYNFLGLKLKIKQSFDKEQYESFKNHIVKPNTILIIEINSCHWETIPGYYKYLIDLGYNVELMTRYDNEGIFTLLNNDDSIKIFEFHETTFDRIFRDYDFTKYERIIYNSKRVYFKANDTNGEGMDLYEYCEVVPKGKKDNIYVQHHIDKINDFYKPNQIILANPSKNPELEKFVVNPHYFGDFKLKNYKNQDVVNFISIGELSIRRRNSSLLIDSVKKLHNAGTTNFKVTIIGGGKVDKIPKDIRSYFDILGRVDYQTMFENLNKADFILPLLDPDIEAHNRYMNSGTSGTFQLIYGFNKPCIIHKIFADIYGFNEKNSIIYECNDKLPDAILNALKLKNDEYKNIQENLLSDTQIIKKDSLSNFQKMLEEYNMPKLSIIIPIYNTEKYLRKCIDSVINQSYQNIEIILVNDGSPNNADEICNEYAKQDSRIKYFSKQNEGVAIARNFGISKATGDYVYCIDSDDTIEKDFIRKIIDTIKESKAELIIIGNDYCKKPTEIIGALPTWAFTVKRSVLDKYPDVRFIEGIQPCEDGLFSHKLLALAENTAKCPNAVYNYRQHANSSEQSMQTQRIIHDMPIWFDILEKFYNEHNLWETHKLYLLSFIENEPFSLRYCTMNFSEDERKFIFDLVHSFIKQHSLNEIPENELQRFPRKFCNFVKSSSYSTYRLKTLFSIKNILETLFSIKNEKKSGIKRKIITILGIKIKIKDNKQGTYE